MWLNISNVGLLIFDLEQTACLWNSLPRSDSWFTPLDIFTLPDYLIMTIYDAYMYSVIQYTFLIQSSRMEINYPSGIHISAMVGIWECSPLTHQWSVVPLNLTAVFVIPQYHVGYDNQLTPIPNDASYGSFADNPFNAYSWDKFVRSGL